MTLTYGVQIKVSQIAGKLDIGFAISADWNRRRQMMKLGGGVMNKQEAIEKVTERMKQLNMGGVIWVKKDDVIEIISQVHEPQKPVIPKFVAERLEECKRSGWHLQKALYSLDDDEKVGNWAYDENDDLINENVDIFARAWLDGYQVEKEKLYTVEIPNPNSAGSRCQFSGCCEKSGCDKQYACTEN
jgi:hypothetical protein